MRRARGAIREEAGQALIFLAIAFLGLLFFVGLAVDTGQLFVARRTMQEAVDAAAFAGATVLYQSNPACAAPCAAAISAAHADAARNGWGNGVNGVTVTVHNPPTSGAYSGNGSYVEVTITSSIRTTLVPQEAGFTSVTVRGVAGADPLFNGYTLMALDQGNTVGALQVSSNGSVEIQGGSIYVNSHNAQAAQNSGSVDVCVSQNPCMPGGTYGLYTAGGYSGSWPTPVSGQPVAPDPYAGYPKPDITGMTVYTTTPPANLTPGVYKDSASISGNLAYTLAQGTYVLKGTSISIAGSASLSGTGVFIFVTNSNYPSSGGACGSVSFSGGANSTVTPPTTGTYKGMLFYFDPACTTGLTLAGSGEINSTQGTIYIPNGPIVMNGNNTELEASQVIAKNVNVQNGELELEYNAGNTAQPMVPALSE